MTEMLRLGMSSMGAAARSYAAQREEKPKVTAGQMMKLGMAAGLAGATIGKDRAIKKGLPEKSKYTAKEAKLSQAIGAGDTEEQAAAQIVKSEPSQQSYQKWGAAAGTMFGIMSGLFS